MTEGFSQTIRQNKEPEFMNKNSLSIALLVVGIIALVLGLLIQTKIIF